MVSETTTDGSGHRNGRLEGKVAIVTGSGKGIGLAEAELMVAEGASVIISDIAIDDGIPRAVASADKIRSKGGDATASTHDVGTFDGARDLVQLAIDTYGRLDILINNAGLRTANRIQDFTEADYDRVIDSHLRSTFALIKYATPVFLSQRSGVIVNTGSEAGLGHLFNAVYSAAKEGVAGLTRTVARELGRHGIRCNLLRPRSEVTVKAPDFVAMLAKHQSETAALGALSLGRRGDLFRPSTPEHVAALAVWLCTDAAADINGRDFFVAGDEIGLWSEPDLIRSNLHPGGWTLDLLDRYAPGSLINGLTNEFLVTI